MTLEKLRPDQDLQCYFERPSAIAALSGASATGFTVSGCWRQQFDWAVVEWNRDNTLEHPLFRPLPDADLSGLRLSYEESRTNCMQMDCDLYPSVEWPFLRVWTEDGGFYRVPLRDHATAAEGNYIAASAVFELIALPGVWEYIGLAWMGEHATYRIVPEDTIASALDVVVQAVNASATMRAVREGNSIRLTAVAAGANGNRIGVYSYGGVWDAEWRLLSGGASPSRWRVELDFANLLDEHGDRVPMGQVRKMRWTYAADFQRGAFERSEFSVTVSSWSVTGSGRTYFVAGGGSYRIEDDSPEVSYSGDWSEGRGNFSGGSIRYAGAAGGSAQCRYRASAAHRLYLGTRLEPNAGTVSVSVDGAQAVSRGLPLDGEDVLVRVLVGEFGAGEHSVVIYAERSYFDFLEVAIPVTELPEPGADAVLALATDWDTDHSISIAPERTAWMIHALGFRGRVNHYAGALWFYELTRQGHVHASATVTFDGTPEFSAPTTITVDGWDITHRNLIADTPERLARAFELEINRQYMAIRAEADGPVLRLWARAMGSAGNAITISATGGTASGPALAGGGDGEWRTDLSSVPRINRAARDWTRSFFSAVHGYGMDAVAAFSMELQHGDPSAEAAIAQRYANGDPVLLNTPALQTNFSPTSLAFWKPVYAEMAGLMQQAGLEPFLQFGEVQWWYFGSPFYDAYTKDRFRALYGREMAVPPGDDERAFLPTLIGEFTDAVMADLPGCKFEVLWPADVNEDPFNRAVNFPAAHWTPAKLDSLKSESFGYTYARDLNKAAESMSATDFPPEKRAHLVGISDHTTPWLREAEMARARGLSSIVLFALDQFCLIGYPAPARRRARRSAFLGR